jgi:hypothetical protein
MTQGLQRQRARRSESRQLVVRISVVVALFLAVLSVELWSGHVHLFDSVVAPADAFSGIGVIHMAPDGQALCERRRLDNKSGAITADGLVRCDEINIAPPAPASEAHQRLHAIRRHFRPHGP